MKQFIICGIMLCLIASLASAQYVFDPSFPNKALSADSVLIGQGNGLHGVAVGKDGNVWTVNYNYYIKGDSLPRSGVNTATLPVRIWKPDGTPASFSPLAILKGAGVNDTLYKGNTGRGLATTPDGNILFTWFDNTYLLDYRNGTVLAKIVTTYLNGSTKASADVAGNIYDCPVFNNQGPLEMFDNKGAKVGNLTDTTRFFSRVVESNRAGDKVYFAGYTGHCLIRYSGDPLGGYVADTVLKGFDCEALCRAGQTDMLWASAGSGNDMPNRYGNAVTSYSSHTWYLWNPANNKIKDSIKWNGVNTFTNADSVGVRPRGVATTVNGDTVYVIMFGSKTGMYSIQRFIGPKATTSVQQESNLVPANYALSQNYPNPFNPTTKIEFSLKVAGNISLKVYDVLGKEVANLATGHYAAGTYSVVFSANNLSSGMYFYTLTAADGYRQTQKMILMK